MSTSSPGAPMVSVIIPCRNAARWIGEQIEAIADQDYDGPIEVIVADNGSSDDSRGVVSGFPSVRWVEARGRAAPNTARNAGAAAATGDLLLYSDADDVVDPGWVGAMVRGLQEFDMVTGTLDLETLNAPELRRFRRRPDGSRFGFLPAANGSNVGIRRSVLEAIGGWNVTYPYGPDDIELAWRAQLEGYTMGVIPSAVVHYRLRSTRDELVTQAYRLGENLPTLITEFRPRGLSYRGFALRSLQFVGFMIVALPALPFSASLRTEWLRRAAVGRGFLHGLRHRGRD